MFEVLQYKEIILQISRIDETTSLAITYGCLVAAFCIAVASRFDDWWWRRWKFKVKMMLHDF
jgi:hypothetical protein